MMSKKFIKVMIQQQRIILRNQHMTNLLKLFVQLLTKHLANMTLQANTKCLSQSINRFLLPRIYLFQKLMIMLSKRL